MAFPDSSSVLDKFQSASEVFTIFSICIGLIKSCDSIRAIRFASGS